MRSGFSPSMTTTMVSMNCGNAASIARSSRRNCKSADSMSVVSVSMATESAKQVAAATVSAAETATTVTADLPTRSVQFRRRRRQAATAASIMGLPRPMARAAGPENRGAYRSFTGHPPNMTTGGVPALDGVIQLYQCFCSCPHPLGINASLGFSSAPCSGRR